MAATGYLLTAFLIWAALTALGAVHVDEPSLPSPRRRRGRSSRMHGRRLRARASEPPLAAGAMSAASAPAE